MKRISLVAVLFVLLPVLASAATVTVYNPSGVRGNGVYVDALLKESMEVQNVTHPSQANNFPREATEDVNITTNEFDEINTLFYERGWTDGLPIVPPTKERVANMMRGSDLSGDFLVTSLPPMNGMATVEKIAINAVMAGCEPKHMPVLLAAVEAMSRDEFDMRGWTTTTNPDAALMILSGPIVKDLDVNDGTNSFGRGWKSNASMSRALHLIVQNIGGSWPGITDMSTMGQPGEFVMLFAENAAANPWAPYHTTMGHSAYANVVTVAAVEGYIGILGIGQTREGFLNLIASSLKGQDRAYRNTVIVVIAQDTASMLAKEGWTRQSMIDYLREKAVVPLREVKEQFIDTGMANKGLPGWMYTETNLDRLVPKPFVDNFQIIVAGGTGEKSMILPCWTAGTPVSNEIRLPSNWSTLIAE